MDEGLLIEINGLPDGSVSRHWDLGKEFFALFGNSDIRDARVSADAKMVKSGDSAVVDILLTGSVTVLCDRCLAPLQIPVSEQIPLSVKFGAGATGAEDRSERSGTTNEEVFLSDEEAALDLSQIVYDYVCLAIPMKRVHPGGACDESVAKYISEEGAPAPASDSPFAGLKALLDARK